jgi:tRNA nucleotidyltransferase/poly(A) polymerase
MKLNWKPKTKIDHAGIKAVKLLQAKGFQAFWVGGIVRNIFLKRPSDNVDIATDAKPEEIEKILRQENLPVMQYGESRKFGTILTIINHVQIEITTFRSEGRYSDNRHPDQVQFIREYFNDAKRRDFTINALYFDPIKKQLYDPTNGLKDLKGKLLRFVGDPKKRIDEDALRMLRGVRLATQLGFKLENNSFAAIKTRAKYIQGVSGERVKAELDKILLSENRVEGLRLLDKTGVLKFIIPEFQKLKDVRHNSKHQHLEGDMFTHIFYAVGLLAQKCDLSLIYATLFHDVGKVITPTKIFSEDKEIRLSYIGHIKESEVIFRRFATKFKFPKNQRELIAWLIRLHDDRRNFMAMKTEHQIRYLLAPYSELLLELWRVDSLANLRLIDGKPGRRPSDAYLTAKKLLLAIKKSRGTISKLAKGDLIMKYSRLKPGKPLGDKIQDVKIQIVLEKIKDEKELKNYLK